MEDDAADLSSDAAAAAAGDDGIVDDDAQHSMSSNSFFGFIMVVWICTTVDRIEGRAGGSGQCLPVVVFRCFLVVILTIVLGRSRLR